jgi:dipeptidyl aminopeptidase/acylaminoacyl peptidase
MSTPRKLLLTAIALAILAAPGRAPAADDAYLSKLPPLLDRELFFGDPEYSGAQLSPNGEYISFVKPYNDVRNVYVKTREEPFDEARPVTADARPVLAYFWSRDSKYILYVQDKLGNENWHVYAVDPSAAPDAESGVPPARDLTPIEGITARIYALPKNAPDRIVVGMNDRDATYHDVYDVSIGTGERKLLIENTEKVGGYTFDLEGNVRLATRQTDDGGTEILRVNDDGTLAQIYTCSWEESAFPIRFDKDGKRFYMETNKGPDADLSRLALMDPSTGAEELVESDPENEVDFGSPVFDRGTDELIATVYVGDKVRIYPRTDEVKKDLEFFDKNLPDGEYNVQSSTNDMRYHLISVSRDVDPGSVYLYDREKKRIELLYKSRPELPSEYLAEMKPVRYRARDGLEIPAYLTVPRGAEPAGLPVVIFPHGGPWARDRWGYDGYAQFLANRGYAVLQMNFRGSAGYGKSFLNAGNKEWGFGAMQHDITDGVKYLIDQGVADPERVAIFGGSYGGYATLAGVTFTPDLYAAAIPYVAPSNLVTLIKSFPAYWRPFMKRWYLRVGDPDDPDDKKDLIARSPLFKASEIKSPMLVVHGLNDPRVKKSESDQLVVALRERGVNVEYIVAPDEGHGFRAPENRMALAVAIERFLAKHIGGRYQEEVPEGLAAKLAELTVDVETIALPDATLAGYAETAPLPEFAPGFVGEMKVRYKAGVTMGDQAVDVDVTRQVKSAELEGTPVWVIETVQVSSFGTTIDSSYVSAKSLRPLKRSMSMGGMTALASFTDDKIEGTIDMGGNQMPIDVDLSAPVLCDGGALEFALGALPLADGYETTLRTFDSALQQVRSWSLAVSGPESVESEAGSYNAYKIVMEPLDGGTDHSTLYVKADAPRYIVKKTGKLHARAGGGDMSMELTSVETAQ